MHQSVYYSFNCFKGNSHKKSNYGEDRENASSVRWRSQTAKLAFGFSFDNNKGINVHRTLIDAEGERTETELSQLVQAGLINLSCTANNTAFTQLVKQLVQIDRQQLSLKDITEKGKYCPELCFSFHATHLYWKHIPLSTFICKDKWQVSEFKAAKDKLSS